YLAFGRGNFAEVDPDGSGEPAIKGDGSYVDKSTNVDVGARTIGQLEVGGGGSGIIAHPFQRLLKINTDTFEYIQLKLVPVALGWFDIDQITHRDIRNKAQRVPKKYR